MVNTRLSTLFDSVIQPICTLLRLLRYIGWVLAHLIQKIPSSQIAYRACDDSPQVASSSVVVLTRKVVESSGPDDALFEKVVKAAFSMRRKTLRNTLSKGLGLESEQVVAALESVGIEPGLRAEKLSVEQFVQIASAFEAASL